jgi:hypothetical protein
MKAWKWAIPLGIILFSAKAYSLGVSPWKIASESVVLAFAATLIFRWGNHDWQKRLTAWAENEGFELLDFKGAHALEGPPGVRSSENIDVFKVRVKSNRAGSTIRSAWIVSGHKWNPFSVKFEVHWID